MEVGEPCAIPIALRSSEQLLPCSHIDLLAVQKITHITP
jgi:hypothetical protein